MKPAESTDMTPAPARPASPADSNLESDLDSRDELVSLFDGFEFASCVARLERHWPSAKVPSTLAPVLQRLGKFEIRKELGRGRFGVVFLAWDTQLQRQVALKVPQFDAALDPELRERFRGEALAAAKLQHPGIVGLYEVGQHAGVDYLAMAYIEGQTLAQRLKTGPLPAREAAQVVRQLAHAVHHAHENGVIHRDLKPSNVLLDQKGEPHVMDFGLARRLSDSAMRATATGQVLGTPAYMPPEQATGQSDIRATSDVYSLGVILYETLTGHPPFQAATFLEAVEFILNRDPIPPSKLNPKLPGELDAIVAKCLEKSPRGRYASAAELASDLENFLEGRPIRAKTHGYLHRGVRWCRKHPSHALLLAASCLAIGLLVITATIYARWQRANELALQQQRIADAERYFATVHRARDIIHRHAPGWSPAALHEIRSAAASRAPTDRKELRALTSECLSGFDLEREANFAAGMQIGRIALSPDGRLLAVGELKGTATCRVLVYDVNSRKLLHTFTIVNVQNSLERLLIKGEQKKFQDGVRGFAFSRDGRYLAAALRFGDIHVFDLSDPDASPRRLSLGDDREPARIAFSDDGVRLFALTKFEYRFLHWPDWRDAKRVESPWEEPQLAFATSIAGSRLFAQSHARDEIKVLDQELNEQHDFAPSAPLPRGTEGSLATDRTGRLLAGESDHGLRVYNAETGELIRRLQDDSPTATGVADELAMTADGKLLSAFDYRGAVRIFDVAAGRQVMNLTLGRSDFQYVALDRQGERLVVADDGRLEFWRINRGRCRSILNHPADEMTDIELAPGDQSIHATGNVGSVQSQMRATWLRWAGPVLDSHRRVDSGFQRVRFSGDGSQVAWSPDGRNALWTGPFGALHYATDDKGELKYIQPVPLTGTVVSTSIRAADEAKDRLSLGDCADAGSGRAWTVRDPARPVAVEIDLSEEIILNRQAPALLVSLQVSGEENGQPPFAFGAQVKGGKPTPGVAPYWFVANSAAGFQQWAISLKAPEGGWNQIRLEINPAAHIHSLKIERADLVLLEEVDVGGAFPPTQVVDHLIFAEDGQTLWAQVDVAVKSWTWPEMRERSSWVNPQHAVTGAANVRAIAPMPKSLLVGSRDGAIIALTADGNSARAIWNGPGSEVTSLTTCSAAKAALAAGNNGKVRGISLPDGEVLFDLTAAKEAIVALAATPDAQWMVIATIDRELQWWRRAGESFELFCELPHTTSVVRALRLSPDGRRLVVLCRDTGVVEAWDLGRLLREFDSLGVK